MEVIDDILLYIQDHFDEALSLDDLAGRAHYSPYHFHRLFKQQVGEAPKQYLSRLRLERAIKELIFYPEKPIQVIALDSGFSSHPVFARAFRNKYGVSADRYRTQALDVLREKVDSISPDVQQYPVTVDRVEPCLLACEMTLLLPEDGILEAFRKLHAWASARDLCGARPRYYGIFIDSPFSTPLPKCRYLAGIRVREAAPGRAVRALGPLTIARIPVLGSYGLLTDYALYVKQRWVRDSGYEVVQGVPGWEYFADVDFSKPYARHYRTICIGIRPK